MNKKEREEIEALREENKWLRGRLNERIHFDIDGESTACGHDAYSVISSDNISEVTCSNCKRIWHRLKLKWDKEQKKEEDVEK